MQPGQRRAGVFSRAEIHAAVEPDGEVEAAAGAHLRGAHAARLAVGIFHQTDSGELLQGGRQGVQLFRVESMVVKFRHGILQVRIGMG